LIEKKKYKQILMGASAPLFHVASSLIYVRHGSSNINELEGGSARRRDMDCDMDKDKGKRTLAHGPLPSEKSEIRRELELAELRELLHTRANGAPRERLTGMNNEGQVACLTTGGAQPASASLAMRASKGWRDDSSRLGWLGRTIAA
jgi:hypothetical protein